MAIRDNKFARQAQLRNRNNLVRNEQPTVEEQLARLEDDLRRLKIEFDIYLNGATKRPPYDTKNRVETIIKRLGDDRTLTFAQRFLFNSLVARYTAFRELWRRTMQNREEGRDPLGAANRQARLAEAAKPQAPSTFVCADPRQDVPTVKRLYETLLEARGTFGEPADDLSFSRFHQLIASKADDLKKRAKCAQVQFSIGVENDQIKFKMQALA